MGAMMLSHAISCVRVFVCSCVGVFAVTCVSHTPSLGVVLMRGQGSCPRRGEVEEEGGVDGPIRTYNTAWQRA